MRIMLVMRAVLMALALTLAFTSLALAQGSPLPFKLKHIYPDTLLVDHGKANAVIVVPDSADYAKIASDVQAAIANASGVTIPIRRASQMSNDYGELLGAAPDKNLILIAGPHCNNVVTHLIHACYCSLDTDYPGKGGSIVHTISDPWGNGVNAILLGGSDLKGVQDAIGRFIAKLPKGDTVTVSHTIDVALPKGQVTADPTDAEIKAELDKQTKNVVEGQQSGFLGPILAAGSAYARTGKEGQVRLYRALIYRFEELRAKQSDPNWGATDFLFGQLVDSWDNVEESPTLSDADRERITSFVLYYAHLYAAYGTTRGMENQSLRNNHNTFTCIGLLKAGHYFTKYYNLDEAKQWTHTAELCFAPLVKSFKSQEDCSAYGWIIMRHVCNYSLYEPDFSWFKSGKADLAGDLYIMTTDNLGHQASYGDCGWWAGNGQTALWATLTDIERKGRYAWAIRKVGDRSEAGAPVHDVEPVEPTDLLGVQCRVTEPMFYSLFNGKGKVPQERTFDKITMRSSFDADKPYLLLDGINGAYHGHQDGNSILRYTDKGRIWLADCDYIKSLPRYHNSMLVLRDGQSGKMPAFVERELAADLTNTGFTSTTTHDYAGTDWRRNILWDKNDTFVFIDEVTAQAADTFSARCVWQTLGVPKLMGNLFQVSQKGPTCSILNLDGARVRYSDDREVGANWNGYEYADPVVHTVQQVQTRKLNAGERICFINVLSTSKSGQAPGAERAGESSALIGTSNDRGLVGIHSGNSDIVPGLTTDARIYWISPSRIALGDTSGLLLNGATVMAVLGGTDDKRVSFETDLKGNATICTQAPVRITIAANPARLTLDGKPAAILPMDNPGGVQIEVPAGRHTLSGLNTPKFTVTLPNVAPAPTQAQTLPVGAKKLAEAAKPEAGAKITALAAGTDCIYAGRADGKLDALYGSSRWTFDAGEPISAIWTGKLAKNDPARIAVGTAKGKIVLLDGSGAKIWERRLPVYKVDPLVDYFMPADLAGDGNRALIMGSDNWHHYAYDAAGKQLWSFMSVRGSTAGTAMDIDGDGKQEPIIGNEYHTIYALNPNGSQRWRLYRVGGPKINAIVACNLGDGRPGEVFGGAEGTVYAYDADMNQVWSYSTGDEITCMALADLDGDGQPEIISGSRSFSLDAIKRDGKRLWRLDVGEPILSMALADLNGDGKPEVCVGTEDGHVLAVDQKGQVIASWSTAGPVRKLAALPGSPTRLAVACDDGRLVLLKME